MNNRTNNNFSLRKLLIAALAVGPLAVLPAPMWALPATQAALDATISTKSSVNILTTLTSPTLVTVNTQGVDRGIITWNNLGDATMTIGSGDTINFQLPSSTSSILNRVIHPSNMTQIDGKIESNGRVFILNPNGVVLSGTATVNAAGFGVSTIAEPDGNFAATGSLSLLGTPSGPVTVSSGATLSTLGATGDVFLAGTNVNVAGTIFANNLTVRSSAGNMIALGSGGALTVGTIGASTTGNVNVAANGASVTIGGSAAAAVTIVGNLIVNSANPVATTTGGAVTLSSTSATSVGGNLTVTTGGGAANLGGSTAGLTTTVGGNSTINTTGASVNGAVSGGDLAATTSAGLINNGSGRTTSIVTGGNSVTAGTVALGGDFTTLTLNSGTTTIRDRSGTIALGNSTIVSTGTAFTITAAGNITNSGTLTVSSGTTTNPDMAVTSTASVNMSIAGSVNFATLAGGTGSNLTLTATGDVSTTGAIASFRDLSITSSGGKLTIGNLTSTSTTTLVAAGDLSIGTITNSGGGTLSLTSNGGKVTTGATVTGATINITAAGDIAPGAITGSNALTITSSAGKLTMGGAISASTTSITTAGDIAITSTVTTSGSNNLTLRSTAGSLTQSAVITNGGTTTLNAAGSVTLNSANAFTNVSLQNSAGGISITDTNAVVVTSSSATGATTITAGGAVVLGASITDAITFASSLTIEPGASAITDAANNVFVFGALNLGGTGTVTLDNLGARYGQVNTTGTLTGLTILESTTLNLGNITVGGGGLDARSANGDVVNSGKLTVAGTSTFGAGSLAVPGNITLNTSTNALTGNVNISAARDVSLTNTVATTLTTVFPISGNATFTQVGTTAFSAMGVDFNTFGGTFGGAVTVSDVNDVTLQNLTVTGAGAVAVTAAGTTTGGNLRLGSGVNIATLGATTLTAGNAGSITDTANGVSIFGAVSFSSANSITLNRAGHSFGAVTLTTANNGSATIVEGGTLNIAGASINGSGSLTASSTGGNIIQAGAIVLGTGTTTLSAAAGSVDLGMGANNFGSGAIGVSALNSVNLVTNFATVLGNITAATGTLTVQSGAVTNITQATGTSIRAFGNTAFITTGGGIISLDNTGNNFGGLTLTTGTGAVTVREQGTLNVRNLTGTGGFTLTSENADIVNSAAVVGTGAPASVAGTISLNAANGSVSFANSGNNYNAAVRVNSKGDASVYNTSALTLLGGTNVGGAFTATTANATISDNGSLLVVGNTTFNAGTGSIAINDNNNQFGAIRVIASSGSLVENTTINLRGGSVVTAGPFIFSTSGDFVTSGVGGSSFIGALTINALGTITPGVGSLLVTGPFTVNSNGKKDLSALSQSGNLANLAPIPQGPGQYVPPGP